MDHVVYVNAKAGELEKILAGTRTVLVRGATGRTTPYGRVHPGDELYLMRNNGEGTVQARATVTTVFNSDMLSWGQSARLIEENQEALQLTPAEIERWAGKRYLVLVGIKEPRLIEPFAIDRSGYGTMDSWLPVDQIDRIIVRETEPTA